MKEARKAVRWRVALAALALAAVTLAVYAPVRGHAFVNWDDPDYVTENPRVQEGLKTEGLAWAFTTGHAGNWHPVTWLSHTADVELWGMDPGGHHLTSALLHALSAALLLLVLVRLTGSLAASAFAAALFALHPAHVESVAWVSERKDVLSALFLWLTLLAYAAWCRRPGAGRFALVAAALAAGLLSKPMLVTAPFLLLLLDAWPLGRLKLAEKGFPVSWQALRPRLVEKLPLFAVVVASSVVTFLVQRAGGAVSGLEAVPLPARLANALVAIGAYLGKFVWPADLAVFYPHPGLPSLPALATSALAVATITWLAWRERARRPSLGVGWLWFLGSLVPVLGLVQVGAQGLADRFTYIPFVGLGLAMGVAGAEAGERLGRAWRLGLGAFAVALCLGWAWDTRAQVMTWKDSTTLFAHGLAVTENNHILHNTFGATLLDAGDAAAALPHLEAAVRIRPRFGEAHNNRGVALHRLGRPAEAAEAFRRVLALEPENAEAAGNLANSLADLGRFEEALGYYRKALEAEPASAETQHNLGLALAQAGRLEEALGPLTEALRLEPGRAAAHGDLATTLARLGRLGEAVEHYREGLRLKPEADALRSNLAGVLAATGRFSEAAAEYRELVRRHPQDVRSRMLLGLACLEAGDLECARGEVEALRGLDAGAAGELEGRVSALGLDRL